MYKKFFGLSDNPFRVNPDPRYLFLTPQTRAALDELTYGIQTRKGLILLTGEVGTGKTTQINYLLDKLHQQRTPTSFVFNSHLEVSELFDFMLADFGIPSEPPAKSKLMRLNQWLIERYCSGDNPVLIVDEAQGLPFDLLEEIRLLLNLETPREKLLQIVLAGQPELEEKLKRPELRQLQQRITLRCKTARLTAEETHGYVHERLRIGGAYGEPVFASEAINALHFYSRGIPRTLNLLCEHALINAYVDEVRPVPARIVEEVAREFQFGEVNALAPTSSFGDATSANLIAMESMLANVLISPPAAAELALKEQPLGPMTHVSAPVAGASPAVSLNKEPITSIPNPKEIPTAEKETKQPSDSSAFASDSAVQLIAEMAVNSAPIASPPVLHLVEANGKFDPSWVSKRGQISGPEKSASRPLTVGATKPIPRRSSRMPILPLLLSLTRWSARWRDRYLSIATSPAWLRMTATSPRRSRRAISGTVRDPSGARVPNAIVSIVSEDTGHKQMITADKTGDFLFPSVTPGRYRVEATSGCTPQRVVGHAAIRSDRRSQES